MNSLTALLWMVMSWEQAQWHEVQNRITRDHYEQWFHKIYGDPLSQEGSKEARKHLLGRA